MTYVFSTSNSTDTDDDASGVLGVASSPEEEGDTPGMAVSNMRRPVGGPDGGALWPRCIALSSLEQTAQREEHRSQCLNGAFHHSIGPHPRPAARWGQIGTCACPIPTIPPRIIFGGAVLSPFEVQQRANDD